MAKYAVLLSGGLNKKRNAGRYRNDLEFAYKVLREDCQYDEKYITCFFLDSEQSWGQRQGRLHLLVGK